MAIGLGKMEDNPYTMTEVERRNTTILLVESDPTARITIRNALLSVGFPTISEANDHNVALQKLEDRRFSHVIFEAKKTNVPPAEFLAKALEINSRIVAIPTSYEPSVDDVFKLLMLGARGYLVKTFNAETVNEAVVTATKGEPLPDCILYAKSRNEALCALIMTALDKLAIITRQAQQFETAKREIPRARGGLMRSVEIATLFAEGGVDKLLEVLVEFCIERGNGPASKLGRIRRRLDQRKKKSPENLTPSTA